jgi:hypothetical protein
MTIKDQLGDYAEHKRLWDESTCDKCLAPVVPIWGPNLEAVKVKIERIYHPEEAKIILEALG